MRVNTHQPHESVFLTDASKDDIPPLLDIFFAAYADDNAARLMLKDSSSDSRQRLQADLEDMVADPKSSVIKAVNKNTGDIVAWLGLASVDRPDTDFKGTMIGVGNAERPTEGERLSRLGAIIKEGFIKKKVEWLSNKHYIYVGTLVTDPAHQGRGAGSALMRWATSKADTDSVPCWLESTPVGHGLYYHLGFRDVGSLEVDLRDFAPGGRDGKRGLGIYQYVNMLRLPVGKESHAAISEADRSQA